MKKSNLKLSYVLPFIFESHSIDTDKREYYQDVAKRMRVEQRLFLQFLWQVMGENSKKSIGHIISSAKKDVDRHKESPNSKINSKELNAWLAWDGDEHISFLMNISLSGCWDRLSFEDFAKEAFFESVSECFDSLVAEIKSKDEMFKMLKKLDKEGLIASGVSRKAL